jgi:hypothetical protein
MILVPLIDLKFVNELLQVLHELQIGGSRMGRATGQRAGSGKRDKLWSEVPALRQRSRRGDPAGLAARL